MKRLFKYTAMFAAVAGIVSACKKDSFLDRKIETLTEEKVFSDSALTNSFINDMYAYTGQDVVPLRGDFIGTPIGGDGACLEDQTSLSNSQYTAPAQAVRNGSYNATNYPMNTYWPTFYKKIRSANLFLFNVPNSPLSPAKKKLLTAEARYLRAFFYASLVRYFGGVQLMGDEILGTNDILVSKRNTYKECIDYIVAELDAAANDLPSQMAQDATEFGHATKGAALALKARMLVTAASPLFNGTPASNDAAVLPYICYSATYSAELWQKAADACKVVMDLGDYALVEDNQTRPGHGFWKQFVKGRRNTELIIPYMQANGSVLEKLRFPYTRNGSAGVNSNPSQNAVELFTMKNGKPITDPTSGYDPKNPWDNREPRFYYSIIYNQAKIWRSGSGATLVPVDIYFDKKTNALTTDGFQAYRTTTGFYSRKMANDSTGTSVALSRSYPVLRLAEMIMGYAESLNELGQTEAAVTELVKLRKRGGVEAGADNRYGIPTGISKDAFRTLLQKESVVEFLYEGHFWYDTRRWLTAPVTENRPIYGIRTTKELDGTFTYVLGTYQNAYWQNRYYLCPIPQIEINKAATLIQNPGW